MYPKSTVYAEFRLFLGLLDSSLPLDISSLNDYLPSQRVGVDAETFEVVSVPTLP